MPRLFLLDTSVLLHWVRDDHIAQAVEERYHLEGSPFRPLVCEVSLGEMLAFSRQLKWGAAKQRRLGELWKRLVVVNLSDRRIHETYADLSTLARQKGWAIFNAKNDLWIAAAARVTEAHLLTLDTDFRPLRSEAGWAIDVLDAQTGALLP